MLGHEKILEVRDVLIKAGIDDTLEAEWLVTLALGKKRISEVYNLNLNDVNEIEINNCLKERIKGKPLSYIIGNTEFYGREFNVNENVLIPRPETEILVEKVIDDIKHFDSQIRVLDLCTGSGIIGITLALETNSKVVCSDISTGAIDVATSNKNKLNANVEIIKSDLFSKIQGKFDIIVSNPPYIKSADMLKLDSTVKDYEPHLALDGGDSGLEFYKKIINQAPNYLNHNGKLYFEIGIEQSGDITELLNKDFKNINIVKDYNKIDRVIIGQLRGE